MNKESIAVYNPTDPLERAIQEAFHSRNDGWLSMYHCQLMAKAISTLKMFDDQWLDHTSLLSHRIAYFFAPEMTAKQDIMVFVTRLLYLRDILENRDIDSYLHNPVIFVTRPLAHYLLREYPIHIYVDMSNLQAENSDADFVQIGGLMITDSDIRLSPSSILNIISKETRSGRKVAQDLVDDIQHQTGTRKVAVSEIKPGVFKSDEHKMDLMPDDEVWDKRDRLPARISKVEQGEMGIVEVVYGSGVTASIPKSEFNTRYVVV